MKNIPYSTPGSLLSFLDSLCADWICCGSSFEWFIMHEVMRWVDLSCVHPMLIQCCMMKRHVMSVVNTPGVAIEDIVSYSVTGKIPIMVKEQDLLKSLGQCFAEAEVGPNIQLQIENNIHYFLRKLMWHHFPWVKCKNGSNSWELGVLSTWCPLPTQERGTWIHGKSFCP